jgi:trans-2,3-dihydro-3-hydroxyanthranilate isomerase
MSSRKFVIADVFTNTPFGGNQLAVIPAADSLTGAQMQSVASEFNFSESVFIESPVENGSAFRVRIFTPRAEVQFAGHPTLGAAAVLAFLGGNESASGVRDILLQEAVGLIPVQTRVHGTSVSARMAIDVEQARVDDAIESDGAEEAAGLNRRSVVDAFRASLGLPFTFLQLATPELVDGIQFNQSAWLESCGKSWAKQLFVFAVQRDDPTSVYARMFAPALGIPEDPATGSAAAALAYVFGERCSHEPLPNLTIRPGVRMGRPSTIRARAVGGGGSITTVEVEGEIIIVARGTIDVPA